VFIEQAFFASDPAGRETAYRLVARSPGVREEDAVALAAWGPQRDSLLEIGRDAVSLNFFALPSGAFCISKTTPVAGRHARRGIDVTTHCLVVEREVLARFANNPFALLNAAFAQGLLRTYDQPPATLQRLPLSGRAATVDQALLASMITDPGVTWLEALVEAVVSFDTAAVVIGPQRARLFAALFNCLPLERRLEFSFSTGLKSSPDRPFQLFCVDNERPAQRDVSRRSAVVVLDLWGYPPRSLTPNTGWSGLVATVIASGNTAMLAEQLATPSLGRRPADLNQLGNQLLEKLALERALGEEQEQALDHAELPSDEPSRFEQDVAPAGERLSRASETGSRADGAHVRFESQTAGAALASMTELHSDPANQLGVHCPEAIEQLEHLDDTVFEAIAGKPGAVESLRTLWPQVLSRLGAAMVEESREQYLHHALRVWRDCIDGDQLRNPALAVAATEVIEILLAH
jgi:hypothetical protein